MAHFDYQDFDREIWDKDLEDFVPSTVYDMHTHMWCDAHRGSLTGEALGLRTEIDYQDHLDWAAKLYPGREFHLLVPDPSDRDQAFIISMTFSVCQRLKFAVFRACYG